MNRVWPLSVMIYSVWVLIRAFPSFHLGSVIFFDFGFERKDFWDNWNRDGGIIFENSWWVWEDFTGGIIGRFGAVITPPIKGLKANLGRLRISIGPIIITEYISIVVMLVQKTIWKLNNATFIRYLFPNMKVQSLISLRDFMKGHILISHRKTIFI